MQQISQMQKLMVHLNEESVEQSMEQVVDEHRIATGPTTSPGSPRVEDVNPMNLTMTPKEHINSGGVTVRSMPETETK